MLVTAASLASAFVGYNVRFLEGAQAAKLEIQHNDCCEVVTDQVGELNFPISEGFPAFRKWPEGKERVWENLAAHNQLCTPDDYELSVVVPLNKFADDQYAMFGKDFAHAGKQSELCWDDIFFQTLAAGETSLCYDGQFFFDSDHPIRPSDPNSATQSNKRTTSPFIAAGDNPYLNLEAGLAQFRNWRAPDGHVMNYKPNELWVGPTNETNAERFATATFGPNGATNIHAGKYKVRVLPDLGTSWLWAKTDAGTKPGVVWKREQAVIYPVDTDPRQPYPTTERKIRYAGKARGVGMLTLPCLLQLNKA